MKSSEIPSNICWKRWTYQPHVISLISSPHTLHYFFYNNCKMGHLKNHQQCDNFCPKNRTPLACRIPSRFSPTSISRESAGDEVVLTQCYRHIYQQWPSSHTTHRRDSNGQFKKCSSEAAHHHGCSTFTAHIVKLSVIKLLSLNAILQLKKKSVYLVILRSELGLRGSSNTWKFCFLPWWSFKAAQLSQITQVQPLQLNSLSTPKQVL